MLKDNVLRVASEKGIKILQMEKELGFGRSTIDKWDKSVPSIERVQKVADFLGVPLSELWKGLPYDKS